MKNVIYAILLFAGAIALYILTLRGVPDNINPNLILGKYDQATMPLELSPERDRFILVKSLAEDHSFSLSPVLVKAGAPDIGTSNGKWYILFAPGISLMALPFYTIGKAYNLAQVFSFGMISIFASFNIVCIFCIMRFILKTKPWEAALAAFLFGFGTTSWSYATTLYQHHVTLFLILSGFMAAYRFRKGGKWSVLFAAYVWLTYAWSIWLDYPNALLLLPNMVYFLLSSFHVTRLRQRITVSWNLAILAASIVFVVIMVAHGMYNQVNYGSWKQLSGGLMSYKEYVERTAGKKAGAKVVTLEDQSTQNLSLFFREESLPHSLTVLLFSRDRGLFFFMPIFIFAVIGIALYLPGMNIELGILFSTVLMNTALYGSWGDPWGGWAFGPRYLIISMSILSMFTVLLLHKIRKPVVLYTVKVLMLVAFLYSSAVSLLGALTTNAIPPKVEADYYHLGYNYFRNLLFFKDGKSSSYVFNTYLKSHISLMNFYLMIYAFVVCVFVILLFIVPLFDRKNYTPIKPVKPTRPRARRKKSNYTPL
jgi:hypothetical protein